MATAVLAGANPMAGLYASFAGPAAGGLLQSTTVMVVATTSAAAVTTAEVMNAGPADPTQTLATLTILAGAFMLLATRLGFAKLMRFVSASVMGGFMFGVGLILILGQLADATGVTTSGGSTLEKALNTLRQWQSFDRASVLTAATAIGISIALGRGKLVSLAPLIGIVVPTLVLKVTGTQVETVESSSGAIAVGLPPLVLPDPGLISPTLVASAAALTIVVLVQAAGVGAAYPNTDGTSNVVTRDFYAQGGSNLASGLVGGIPVGGSVGQTAFNVMAGGRTRWAVIISGLWMLVFVVALGPASVRGADPRAGGAADPGRLRIAQAPGAGPHLADQQVLRGRCPDHHDRHPARSDPHRRADRGGPVPAPGRHQQLEDHAPCRPRTDRPRPVATRPDPTELVPGQVTVLDIEGSGTFASVPAAVRPVAPATGQRRTDGQPSAVVLRLHGHLRTNLTFVTALENYANGVARAGGTLSSAGCSPGPSPNCGPPGCPSR